jgi:peroxiredoxin
VFARNDRDAQAGRLRARVRARVVLAVSTALLLSLGLAGCTNDALAQQYRDGSSKNYVAGDGSITEITVKNRGKPIRFSADLEDGTPITSSAYTGRVVVVNFWYAGCPPCRAEAPDLEKTYTAFSSQGVRFLGVNVRDQAATARSFASEFGITYPSVLDVDRGTMQLAFSGVVAPNAVPTTIVLDRNGRVAARVLGKIPDASVLEALITTVLKEPSQ